MSPFARRPMDIVQHLNPYLLNERYGCYTVEDMKNFLKTAPEFGSPQFVASGQRLFGSRFMDMIDIMFGCDG